MAKQTPEQLIASHQKFLDQTDKFKAKLLASNPDIERIISTNNQEIAQVNQDVGNINNKLEDLYATEIVDLTNQIGDRKPTAQEKQKLLLLKQNYSNARLNRIKSDVNSDVELDQEDLDFLSEQEKQNTKQGIASKFTDLNKSFITEKELANKIARIQPIANVQLPTGDTALQRLLVKELGPENIQIDPKTNETLVKLPGDQEFRSVPEAGLSPNLLRTAVTLGTEALGGVTGSAGGPMGAIAGAGLGAGTGEAFNVNRAISDAINLGVIGKDDISSINPEVLKQAALTGGLTALTGGLAPAIGPAIKGLSAGTGALKGGAEKALKAATGAFEAAIPSSPLKTFGKDLQRKGFLLSPTARKAQGEIEDAAITNAFKKEFENVEAGDMGKLAQEAVQRFVNGVKQTADNQFKTAEDNFFKALDNGNVKFMDFSEVMDNFKKNLFSSADTDAEKNAANSILKAIQTKLNATRLGVAEGRLSVGDAGKRVLFTPKDLKATQFDFDPITGVQNPSKAVLSPGFDPTKVTAYDLRATTNQIKDLLDGLEKSGTIVSKKAKTEVAKFLSGINTMFASDANVAKELTKEAVGDVGEDLLTKNPYIFKVNVPAINEFKQGYKTLADGYKAISSDTRDFILGKGFDKKLPTEIEDQLLNAPTEIASQVRQAVDTVLNPGEKKLFNTATKQRIISKYPRNYKMRKDITPEQEAIAKADTTRDLANLEKQGIKAKVSTIAKKPESLDTATRATDEGYAFSSVFDALRKKEGTKGAEDLLGDQYGDFRRTVKRAADSQTLAGRPANLFQFTGSEAAEKNPFINSLSLPIPKDVANEPAGLAGTVIGGLLGSPGGIPGALGGAAIGGGAASVLTSPATMRFAGNVIEKGGDIARLASARNILGAGQQVDPQLTEEELLNLKTRFSAGKLLGR